MGIYAASMHLRIIITYEEVKESESGSDRRGRAKGREGGSEAKTRGSEGERRGKRRDRGGAVEK